MTHKPITTAAAVVALVLSGGALAATDDMGMQYTSASEGLSGSFRVELYNAVSKADPADRTKDLDTVNGAALESLRLNFAGSADLGNGLSSTYAMELRNQPQGSGKVSDDGTDRKAEVKGTYAHGYHIGLDGVFGSLQFGRVCGAGCMVPGGSLDSLKGSSRKSPSEDPGDGYFKFTSPSINGLQFGFGAQLNDNGKPSDNLLDEVNFAAVYDTPLGLKLGAAYEKESNPDSHEDDITGYRFGAQYGQDNWKVAYEFRTYDNYGGEINDHRAQFVIPARVGNTVGSNGTAITSSTKANTTIKVLYDEKGKTIAQSSEGLHLEGDVFQNGSTMAITGYVDGAFRLSNASRVYQHGDGKGVNDYAVHAFGVQFSLDKVTASANYSVEEVSYDQIGGDTTPASLDRTALGVDVKYALGSKSSILLGFKSVERETHTQNDLTTLGTSRDESETTLRYQVDF